MMQPNPKSESPVVTASVNRISQACNASGFGSLIATDKYRDAIKEFDAAHPDHKDREQCCAKLADIFVNFIQAGKFAQLKELPCAASIAMGEPLARLTIGAAVCDLLKGTRVSDRAQSFREELVVDFTKYLFVAPIHPTENALGEVQMFLKHLPSFVDRIVAFEQERGDGAPIESLLLQDTRKFFHTVELTVTNLRLVVTNSMPAPVAMKVTEAMLLIESDAFRHRVADMWQRFARSSECHTSNGTRRIPNPIGRPALLGAIKGKIEILKYYGVGNYDSSHSFNVFVPHSAATWKYFADRLTALSAIKDPIARGERIGRYVVSFCECVAAESFYEREERIFREVNLDGEISAAQREFYKDTYGVDNGPGPEHSFAAEQPLQETANAFRFMAAARYGLNVRKGYARSLQSKRWLLEDMAEQLKGDSKRYRVADIESYPGPGIRMFNLDIRNALDLSTSESRLLNLKACPWIAASMRAGQDVEYHLFRGFKAIARSLDAAAHPMGAYWAERGCVGEEPYAALIFNDHFHNNRLPEVRMWLVPERVLHRKLMFAIENGVDVNKLDVTPEGLAEEADLLRLDILDVGCSCVRWGSFANSWPFGKGPAHDWEEDSSWSDTKWQSPRHIHRALRERDYRQYLTAEVAEVMARSRIEHDRFKKVVQFFLDLHSSFLTMEEAWAKEYANSAEAPAKIERPQRDETPGAGETDVDPANGGPRDGLNPSSLTEERPRTRILQHFLELRNQVVRSRSEPAFEDFPNLELQYTRLFSRQAETPFITGADMVMYLPKGKRVPLLPTKALRGDIVEEEVEMSEAMEAAWVEHVVSKFAPNNCPRIILP